MNLGQLPINPTLAQLMAWHGPDWYLQQNYSLPAPVKQQLDYLALKLTDTNAAINTPVPTNAWLAWRLVGGDASLGQGLNFPAWTSYTDANGVRWGVIFPQIAAGQINSRVYFRWIGQAVANVPTVSPASVSAANFNAVQQVANQASFLPVTPASVRTCPPGFVWNQAMGRCQQGAFALAAPPFSQPTPKPFGVGQPQVDVFGVGQFHAEGFQPQDFNVVQPIQYNDSFPIGFGVHTQGISMNPQGVGQSYITDGSASNVLALLTSQPDQSGCASNPLISTFQSDWNTANGVTLQVDGKYGAATDQALRSALSTTTFPTNIVLCGAAAPAAPASPAAPVVVSVNPSTTTTSSSSNTMLIAGVAIAALAAGGILYAHHNKKPTVRRAVRHVRRRR